MKKTFFSLFWLFAALAVLGLGSCRSIQSENMNNQEPPDFHTARISLSWAGPYTGSISSGGRIINALLHLNSDDTFELAYSYADMPDSFFTAKGKFKWDKTGSNITLDAKDFPPYYWVVSNGLIQLDSKGQIITGTQAENYVLKK
jgi:uncharacterized lipoprotein NlpE involved in copper resistance